MSADNHDDKKHHIFYKTVNRESGRYYYGIHSTDDLGDGYLGSGDELESDIEKFGSEGFCRKILEYCSSRDEAKELEKQYVGQKEVDDPMCYNKKLGG